MKSYSEMITKSKSYIDRFNYLKINDQKIGATTFGSYRYLNQRFYLSDAWEDFCERIHERDSINGYICDLGCEGFEINEIDEFTKEKTGIVIMVHHINPVTIQDLVNNSPMLLDPENAITVTQHTHNAIHYGGKNLLCTGPTIRVAGDTKCW